MICPPSGHRPFKQHLFNIACKCCLNINFYHICAPFFHCINVVIVNLYKVTTFIPTEYQEYQGDNNVYTMFTQSLYNIKTMLSNHCIHISIQNV